MNEHNPTIDAIRKRHEAMDAMNPAIVASYKDFLLTETHRDRSTLLAHIAKAESEMDKDRVLHLQDRAKAIAAELRELPMNEREVFMDELTADFCKHCWGESPRGERSCQCSNDE